MARPPGAAAAVMPFGKPKDLPVRETPSHYLASLVTQDELAFFSIIFAGAPDDPLAAARLPVHLHIDPFVGVGLQDPAAAGAGRGPGRIADVVALTAVGLDLDAAKASSTQHYPPARPTALQFSRRIE